MAKDKRDMEGDGRAELDADDIVIRKRTQVVRKSVTRDDVLKAVGTMIGVVREKMHPLVQIFSDAASAPFASSCVLCIGGRAISLDDTGEATQASGFAEGLSASLGGFSKQRQESIRAAVGQSVARARPWVLGVEGIADLSSRRFFAKELSRRFPGVIVADAAEVAALAGEECVDAEDENLEAVAIKAAAAIAAETHATVMLTGAVDTIVCEDRPVLVVKNGAPEIVAKVPGWAAAKASLVATFLALLRNHKYAAAACASLIGGVAAEIAYSRCKTPQAFAAAYADTLATVTSAEIAKRANIEIQN